MLDQSGSEELTSEVIVETERNKLFWGKNQRERSRHKGIVQEQVPGTGRRPADYMHLDAKGEV